MCCGGSTLLGKTFQHGFGAGRHPTTVLREHSIHFGCPALDEGLRARMVRGYQAREPAGLGRLSTNPRDWGLNHDDDVPSGAEAPPTGSPKAGSAAAQTRTSCRKHQMRAKRKRPRNHGRLRRTRTPPDRCYHPQERGGATYLGDVAQERRRR